MMFLNGGRRGCVRIVVGLTDTLSHLWRSVTAGRWKHHRVLRFPPPIKLTATI